jgi:DNA-binding winged helix-turn-helix (wHTH) protein/TolB-like protein
MTNQRTSRLQFDDICLDLRNFKILKADVELALEPKALLLLTYLIDNRDRLVEKRELLDAIWKDAAVTENALTREIGKLRRTLGDDPKTSKYIQTVHTRGYRFIAAVEVLDGPPERAIRDLVEHSPERDRSTRPIRWPSHRFLAAMGVVVLIVAGTFLLRRPAAGTGMSPMAANRVTRLAILPFRSLAGDAVDRDFGLGIADALITKLGNTAKLQVEPVSTVLHYVDPRKDSLSIGRAMGVDYVLEGKFQKLGERMRVTVQLLCIMCRGGSQWAASFDETSGDLFAVQDSISQRVMAALPVELNGDEQRRIAKRETSKPQAQMAFSKGRMFLNEDSKENLEKAIGMEQAAVSLDPGYAAAWAVLADSYRKREWYGVAPADFLPLVRSAIAKASKLDDSVAYTHAMMGLVAFQYDWDLATAEREYKRARELQPSFNHQWYARYLLAAHRPSQAESEYQRFIRAAPFSVAGRSNFAEFLFLTGQYPRALEQIDLTLAASPDYAPAHELRGLVFEQQGKIDNAVGEFQKAIDLTHGYKGLASLGHLYAAAGQAAEAQTTLRNLEAQRKQRYVAPFELALIHEGSRDDTKVLEDLAKAYADRSLSAQSLLFDPRLNELRKDARYRELVKRIGL